MNAVDQVGSMWQVLSAISWGLTLLPLIISIITLVLVIKIYRKK